MDFHRFAQWFRGSSPYIRAHRGKRFVMLLPKACLGQPQLDNIVRDLALLHVLGIHLLLVLETSKHELTNVEEKIRALFNRGLPSSRYRNQSIPLFVETLDESLAASHSTDETHAQHRDEFIERLESSLQQKALGVVTISGNEPVSTEAHTLSAGSVAGSIALAIHAEKLIVFHDPATLFGDADDVNSDLSTEAFGQLLTSGVFDDTATQNMRGLLHACQNGVKRGHIVSFANDGALLAELFTADGSGTQISTDDYLTIRRAASTDVDSVLDLMSADIEQDRIVPRTRELLNSPTTTIFIAEHDRVPVGCVALYRLVEGMQEIGTLLAAPKHRDKNIGSRLLTQAEAEARKREASHVFAFSKHAVDWFCRHDYEESTLETLPAACRSDYDSERQSTLLIKKLA